MKRGVALLLAAGACAGASAQQAGWSNETAGGPLRPGVYGRIAVHGAPPPLVNARPVMVERPTTDRRGEPVYLYVPPGQVRRWAENCRKWSACGRPVYFVRMDDSPSRLGAWKRTQAARAGDSPVVQALNRFEAP